MRRREFIALIAALWPSVAAQSQHAAALPSLGFLIAGTPSSHGQWVAACVQRLRELGWIEGRTVAIEYRWADNNLERLPALATDLVHRRVAVIATFGPPTASAAKAATTTIPIAFLVPEDPVRLGLVTSLARPGGNLTGINFLPAEVAGKRLALLRELVPGIVHLAVFVDSNNKTSSESTLQDMEAALRTMGLQSKVYYVNSSRDIDTVFDGFVRERPDAVFVAISASFVDRRVQFALQAMLHKLPATYASREFTEVGGLMTYGASLRAAIRQTGVYAGRILKGAKPADMPVVQSEKLELVINHQTARMLGLTVPPALLARADEVIE